MAGGGGSGGGSGGGGSSILQLVRTIIVPSDTDTVQFSGLDGDQDGYYIVRGKIISGNANDRILLRPVPGSDANLSSRGLIATDVAVTPTTSANAIMVENGVPNSVSLIFAEFFASKVDGLPRGGKLSGIRSVGLLDYYYDFGFGWADTVTDISQLDIFSDGGSGVGIKAGSVISLLKNPLR